MARHSNGPWFRASVNTWYATIDGIKINLHVKGRGNLNDARRAWMRLFLTPTIDPIPVPIPSTIKPTIPPPNSITLTTTIDRFLDSRKGTIKPTTWESYLYLLGKASAQFGTMGIDKIKVGDVQKWLNTLPVSKSTQGDIATLLLMCFRWAEGEDLIAVNPLRKLKKPACESRGTKAMISPADHLKLMGAATPALRSILLFLHETGCRPSEATRLTATNIDFANHVIILHEHKTDHTGKPRLIVLTPTIRELLSELVAVNPNGPLMRNARGGSWTKNSLGLAFRRACKIANVNAIAYGYRHTYATDALASGVPDATVAALLGHSSTTMLHKHYSHISSRTDVLRNAALKVRG